MPSMPVQCGKPISKKSQLLCAKPVFPRRIFGIRQLAPHSIRCFAQLVSVTPQTANAQMFGNDLSQFGRGDVWARPILPRHDSLQRLRRAELSPCPPPHLYFAGLTPKMDAMDLSPNLALTYLAAAQAQKHVSVNETFRALDAIVQASVLSRAQVDPPASPADGDRYVVATPATGAWAGHGGKLAAWQDGGWTFHQPRAGWLVWIEAENLLVVFDGAVWIDAVHAGSGTNPAALVGVNTTADSTNRLAVKSDAVLLSHDDVTPGTGSIQLKVNKATPASTAAVLFQTNFSGRAEFGLTGNDDWHVKVSPDGATFHEALVVDRNTGKVTLPHTPSREFIHAARTYYVRTTGNDANNGLSAGAPFLTIQAAINAANRIDAAGFTITIDIGPGTFAENIAVNSAVTGIDRLTFRGAGENITVIGANAATAFSINVQMQVQIIDLTIGHPSGGNTIGLLARFASTVYLSGTIGFNACLSRQLAVDNAGYVETANCAIKLRGGAGYFIYAVRNGHILLNTSNVVVSTTAAVNFGSAFVFASTTALLTVLGVTFNTAAGAVTGQRYQANTNAVISTNGASATYFPGTIAGALATGGQYV